MNSEYQNSVTISVPSNLIDDANHLALLMGESSGDIQTFRRVTYTNGSTEYAVSHTVVKPIFLSPTQTGKLPPTPPHAEGIVDRDAAQRAFDSLHAPGGIRMAVDVDPHEQFVAWGLTPIEDDIDE